MNAKKMIENYYWPLRASQEYGIQATEEDYIKAYEKYLEAPDAPFELSEKLTDDEIWWIAFIMENQHPSDVYYNPSSFYKTPTLIKEMLLVPSITDGRESVIHEDVLEPLYSIITSKLFDRHPGKLHVEKYRLDEDIEDYVSFFMTVDQIKFHMKNMGFKGYSKYKKKELVQKYIEIITSEDGVRNILEKIHPVELLVLRNKMYEQEFLFWTEDEGFEGPYINGLIFDNVHDSFYMHPAVEKIVRKIDIDGIIEAHKRNGSLPYL